MNKKSRGFAYWLRDIASTWLLAIVVLIAGLVFTYQFVSPAPPRHIVLATGEAGGAYQQFGQLLAESLARDGVEVELRETAGSAENLDLLQRGDEVDLAFVQGGLAQGDTVEGIVTMGTMYLEPLWFFFRNDLAVDSLGDLDRARIALGPSGSGTRAVAARLLAANGIDEDRGNFLDIPTTDIAAGFMDGRVDAAFLIAAPESGVVTDLVRLPGVRFAQINRVDAYTRRYAFLSSVVMPRGVLDLQLDRPATEIRTVAVGAMLATTEEFHPALTDLILVKAGEIFGKHGLLSDAGEFPAPRFTDLPLSHAAQRHYQHGPPFLMRYMPFWAATLVDRIWIMLLPLIGLSVPLAKLVPPAYRWRIRRRLLNKYGELDLVDPRHNPVGDEEDRSKRLQLLDELEGDPILDTMPRSYADDVYKLRRDIDLVRRRLLAPPGSANQYDVIP